MAKTPLPVRTLKIFLLLLDALGLWLIFNIVFGLRIGHPAPDLLLNFNMYVVMVVLLATIYVFDLYNPQSQIAGLKAPGLFWIAMLVGGGLLAALAYLMATPATMQYGRGVVAGALVGFAVYGSLSRLFLGYWVRSRGQQVRWLVVGDTRYIQLFKNDIDKNPVEGQFTWLSRPQTSGETPVTDGTWNDLAKKIREPWTGIVVACEERVPDTLLSAFVDARIRGTRLYDLADFYQQIWNKVPVFYLDQLWLALTQGFSLLHNQMGLRIKRLGDLMGALILLPIALPVMAVAALLILIESGLPVVFHQTRTGKDGRAFTLYKLRTMKKDAEKDGAQWAKKNDSRITFFGRIFRKTRIDELPQLFNVLKGEMSFIGPRPERPEFNKDLEKQIPHYNLRHVVRPGITGWAQVRYPYGASVEDAREKLQYDLYYIKNYSLLMDIAIILKTTRLMLFGRGR